MSSETGSDTQWRNPLTHQPHRRIGHGVDRRRKNERNTLRLPEPRECLHPVQNQPKHQHEKRQIQGEMDDGQSRDQRTNPSYDEPSTDALLAVVEQ